MKQVRALAGWAAVIAVIAGAIVWSLRNDLVFGPWLLAAFLLGHAIVHIMYAVPAPKEAGGPVWPFDPSRSWLVSAAGIEASVVRTIVFALAAVTVLCFAVAALATVGLVVPAAWWGPAVAAGALASGAVLVLTFSTQLVMGLGIDAVLLWTVAAQVWQP